MCVWCVYVVCMRVCGVCECVYVVCMRVCVVCVSVCGVCVCGVYGHHSSSVLQYKK